MKCTKCDEVITGQPYGNCATPYCGDCVGGDRWREPNPSHNQLTAWNWMVGYPSRLTLGERVDIGAFTYLNAKCGITIKSNAQIASHCAIYSSSSIDAKEGEVVIEADAKIGAHSTVMPGITIGEDALVGAYSYVTDDIDPGERVAGIPHAPLDE